MVFIDSDGKFLKDALQFTADSIPENKLRFGLGIGSPEDIVNCVRMGWDMFDCVIPTREGCHGRLFYPSFPVFLPLLVSAGKEGARAFYKTINLTNAKFAKDFSLINENSKLTMLKKYSKAYLHHLFKINDPLAGHLASLNNLEFYLELMKNIRLAILEGKI